MNQNTNLSRSELLKKAWTEYCVSVQQQTLKWKLAQQHQRQQLQQQQQQQSSNLSISDVGMNEIEVDAEAEDVDTPKSSSPATPTSVSPTSVSPRVQFGSPFRETYEMCILDWDDTCYPTSYFVRHGKNASTQLLFKFGQCLYTFLQTLISCYGAANIYIITNAKKEWVYRSLRESSKQYQIGCALNADAQKLDYFAAIYNGFVDLNIQVISACDLYSHRYKNQPLIWKINAFKDITQKHFTVHPYQDDKYSILSIGDSEDEFTASLEAKQVINKQIRTNPYNQSEVLLHRVKLRDDPTLHILIQQLVCLSQNLHKFSNLIKSEIIRL